MTSVTDVATFKSVDAAIAALKESPRRWTNVESLFVSVGWQCEVAEIARGEIGSYSQTAPSVIIIVRGVGVEREIFNDNRKLWLYDRGSDRWGERHTCANAVWTPTPNLDRGERRAQLDEKGDDDAV